MLRAAATAAPRERTSSLVYTCARCDLTVASDTCSARAISALESPSGDLAQNVEFARGERRRRSAQPVQEPTGHGGGERALAGRGGADRREQVFGRCVLQEIAVRACFDGSQDVGVAVVIGEDQHSGRGGNAPQCPRRVHTRFRIAEAKVHEDDVGVKLERGPHRVVGGRGIPHHREPVVGRDERAQSGTHDRMVIGDQHRDRLLTHDRSAG